MSGQPLNVSDCLHLPFTPGRRDNPISPTQAQLVGGIDLDDSPILDDQRYRTVLHLSEHPTELRQQLFELILAGLAGLYRPALVQHATLKVDVSD